MPGYVSLEFDDQLDKDLIYIAEMNDRKKNQECMAAIKKHVKEQLNALSKQSNKHDRNNG
jgi:predicted transcriptional regulator